ncbi:Methylenetetrahydrofolate reductase [Modestobacter italicus]|uniref:Methylenetetrahydrofolate reductase n=2 Tax=Modestobacter italicus (strain DSM 44449 / CECT 9708 / BC 501) TaxID=2732864 RepID=I4EU72_MODI5|nr:Methylenetetrahydrofolate reductase [Modestobacter marinus]
MTHGPCGGVGVDGGCEAAPGPCVFLGRPTVRWAGDDVHPPAPEAPLLALMRQRPVVVADLPAAPLSRESLVRGADVLAGSVDAVLLGDSGGARVQFPPAYRAALVQARGVPAWAGLTCRDRNRVALEGELAALADTGAAAVHCVTGDHTSLGDRPDARPVFDLDSTELAARAATAGLLVSVAEAPAGPPVAQRPERLAEKVRAGAQVCVVNHCGGPDAVADFVAAAVAAGADVPFVVCVAVALDPASAAELRRFPGLVLPAGYLASIESARDPHRAGVSAAVALAEACLSVPGVRGVDLSAVAPPGRELSTADALATIGKALS